MNGAKEEEEKEEEEEEEEEEECFAWDDGGCRRVGEEDVERRTERDRMRN